MYPLLLEPVALPKVWGGDALARRLHLDGVSSQTIGEVWSLSALPERPTLVRNGPMAGMALPDALARMGRPAPFPLLVKFLHAREPLSLQVHPDDALAHRLESHAFGKSEAWFILESSPDARVIHGLARDTSREDLFAALSRGTFDKEKHLRLLAVEPGDVIPVPPGTVHATLGSNLVWVEVQQSSDFTYRIHDWGRHAAGRELHLDKARQAIDESLRMELPLRGVDLGAEPSPGASRRRLLWACDAFVMEELWIDRGWTAPSRPGAFEILTVLGGGVDLVWDAHEEFLRAGQSVLIPEAGRPTVVRVRPDPEPGKPAPAQLLRTYVRGPDEDLAAQCRTFGVAPADYQRHVGH